MVSDVNYINKFPEDAAEIARDIRGVDFETATKLLQLWGSKQRDIGALKAIEMMKERLT